MKHIERHPMIQADRIHTAFYYRRIILGWRIADVLGLEQVAVPDRRSIDR
jgi:hypothetical protein